MYPDNGQPPRNWGQQYQGLGYFQQPPPSAPPPRRRGNLVVILSIVALVVIIGAVVAIVLINRDDDAPPQAQPTSTSTTQTSPPPSRSNELEPRNPGWTVIRNEQASLIYEVPPAWTPSPGGTVVSKTLDGVVLSFPATLEDYTCEGRKFSRGGLGGGTVAKSDPGQVATKLAKALGEEFYASATPAVQVTDPVPVTIDGPGGTKIKGMRADGIVTTTGNACMASKGVVAVAVFDGPDKYSFLVVNTDTTGGPADPPPPDQQETTSIITNARMY